MLLLNEYWLIDWLQDEMNQEESKQDEVDGMNQEADSTGEVMHTEKSDWWFTTRTNSSPVEDNPGAVPDVSKMNVHVFLHVKQHISVLFV